MSTAPDVPARTSPAGSPASDVFAYLPAVDIATVNGAAGLLDRYDRKYLLDVGDLPAVLSELDGLHRLVVRGAHRIDYTTTYYDHPDLHTYRAHLQGRRRRYKVRVRTYGDGPTVLEVKAKSRDGRTEKHRTPHLPEIPMVLGDEAERFAAWCVEEAYGFALPRPLVATVTTRFTRTTLTDLDAGERLTFDFDLCVTTGGTSIRCAPQVVTLETKSPVRYGRTHRILRSIGVRPERVSKYAVGVAVHFPDVPANPWHPALRRLHPDALAPRRA